MNCETEGPHSSIFRLELYNRAARPCVPFSDRVCCLFKVSTVIRSQIATAVRCLETIGVALTIGGTERKIWSRFLPIAFVTIAID